MKALNARRTWAERVLRAAGPAFRHLATNHINEPIMATPALSRGVIFVRGKNSIVAIGRQMKQ